MSSHEEELIAKIRTAAARIGNTETQDEQAEIIIGKQGTLLGYPFGALPPCNGDQVNTCKPAPEVTFGNLSDFAKVPVKFRPAKKTGLISMLFGMAAAASVIPGPSSTAMLWDADDFFAEPPKRPRKFRRPRASKRSRSVAIKAAIERRFEKRHPKNYVLPF